MGVVAEPDDALIGSASDDRSDFLHHAYSSRHWRFSLPTLVRRREAVTYKLRTYCGLIGKLPRVGKRVMQNTD